jgi:hypothetical protein
LSSCIAPDSRGGLIVTSNLSLPANTNNGLAHSLSLGLLTRREAEPGGMCGHSAWIVADADGDCAEAGNKRVIPTRAHRCVIVARYLTLPVMRQAAQR